jgi:HD-GYP domain-containing protein (c-di-GMP phosphodiesterase class II)
MPAIKDTLKHLGRIGAALCAEKDLDRLLTLILSSARELTRADSGSLYLTDPEHPERMFFKLAQNDSIETDFSTSALPITRNSIAGYAALERCPVRLNDTARIPATSPYRYNDSFDKKTGYQSVSMLVVPLVSPQGELLGVIQLINRRPNPERPLGRDFSRALVLPFEEQDEDLMLSLSGQAAVALENSRLYARIRRLFDSFVRASVTAIESRDPATSGHSERVAAYCARLARASGKFKEDEVRQLEYAALLHDFGKIGVNEAVLVKAKKLYPHELQNIEQRGREVALHMRLASIEAEMHNSRRPDLEAQLSSLHRNMDAIRTANNPTVLEDGTFDHIQTISKEPLDVTGCDILTLLSPEEAQRLGIRRGSLSPAERREIESHATHSYNYLKRIPWTEELVRVPEIAHAHHEKLNGKGYPQGLAGDAVCIEARILTICDIWDALTASDRPYKKAVPTAKALSILDSEAEHGALDPDLLALFVDNRCYTA